MAMQHNPDLFLKIRVVMMDLIHNGNGWSANASWQREREIIVPRGASSLAIARAAKRVIGAQGFRPDPWSGADWSWRSGSVGAYAEIVD